MGLGNEKKAAKCLCSNRAECAKQRLGCKYPEMDI